MTKGVFIAKLLALVAMIGVVIGDPKETEVERGRLEAVNLRAAVQTYTVEVA